MALTEQERADVMRRVLQDDHVQAFERLRAAAHTWLRWPFSRERLNAVIDAYIDVHSSDQPGNWHGRCARCGARRATVHG